MVTRWICEPLEKISDLEGFISPKELIKRLSIRDKAQL